jgi:cobalamin synthase
MEESAWRREIDGMTSAAGQLRVAAALAVGRATLVEAQPVSERVEGLAWLPLVGLAVGSAAAIVASAGAFGGAPVAAVAGALVLGLGRGDGGRRPIALIAGAVQAAALVTAPAAVRVTALVAAPMLARWACVVQCYGGRPGRDATGLAALAGRARFREFAVASVTALGAMLGLLDAVGLAVVVACALLTLAIRVVAYRRAGGLDDGALNATSALVETSALVLLSWIGSLLS